MTELSPLQIERSRKAQSLVLQELANIGQKPVADVLGIDESTMSRLKNGQLKQFSNMLAFIELQITKAAEKPCPEGCTPIPNRMILSAFLMVLDAYGNGPRVMAWQGQLERLGLIELTDDGRVILPKGFGDD